MESWLHTLAGSAGGDDGKGHVALGEVRGGLHVEEVDGGEVEELDCVGDEDADAEGFGGHC